MVEMKVLGSHEEWLRARTKIGGSDASAIVGMNPYKTNVDLFKEKAYGIEPEDISDKALKVIQRRLPSMRIWP